MVCMSWKSLVPEPIAILGIILSLYGANYYDTLIGYVGLILIIAAIVLAAVIKLSGTTRRKESLEVVEL